MRKTSTFTGLLRMGALAVAIAFGAAFLPSSSAFAEGGGSCVCSNGSGGCGNFFYFCCDFSDSGYTCGCVFLGLGRGCTVVQP